MKAYIFDLDGVLVFTDHLHYQAWKKLADELDIYFDEKINNRLRGVSRMESLNIILEGSDKVYTESEKKHMAERKNKTYQKLLEQLTPEDIDPEARETLQELRSRGHKLAIGSSSKNTRYILKRTNLLNEFDAVSDGTNITHSKPDPEVFLKAAEFLGEQPENCIVVEDACAGIEAAKAAGMTAIGVGEASAYARTDYSIQKFASLLEPEWNVREA